MHFSCSLLLLKRRISGGVHNLWHQYVVFDIGFLGELKSTKRWKKFTSHRKGIPTSARWVTFGMSDIYLIQRISLTVAASAGFWFILGKAISWSALEYYSEHIACYLNKGHHMAWQRSSSKCVSSNTFIYQQLEYSLNSVVHHACRTDSTLNQISVLIH